MLYSLSGWKPWIDTHNLTCGKTTHRSYVFQFSIAAESADSLTDDKILPGLR